MNWYKVAKTKTKKDSCWRGYEQVGMKEKNGKEEEKYGGSIHLKDIQNY